MAHSVFAGGSGLLGTHAVNGTTMSDRNDPTGRAALARVEPGGLTPDLNHDFLCDVLGHLAVTDNLTGNAEHNGREGVVQAFKRCSITTPHATEEDIEVNVLVGYGAQATRGSHRLAGVFAPIHTLYSELNTPRIESTVTDVVDRGTQSVVALRSASPIPTATIRRAVA
jgi:hypothetical protein